MVVDVLIHGRVVMTRELPECDFSWEIGRESTELPADAVVIPEADISRHHARLMRRGCVLEIEDNGSTNGVFLDGRKQESNVPAIVTEDTEIKLATVCLLRLRKEEQVKPSPHPAIPSPVENDVRPPVSGLDCPSPEASASAEANEQETAWKNDEFFAEIIEDYAAFKKLYTMKGCKKNIRALHTQVVNQMNLKPGFFQSISSPDDDDDQKKKKENALCAALEDCVREKLNLSIGKSDWVIPSSISRKVVTKAVMNELVGYGPVSVFLDSPKVSEIMVNGPYSIFVEIAGVLRETGFNFFDNSHLIQVIQRIVAPLGRHIDDSSPMVDARLPGGSRVNAVIPPLAIDGPSLTVRKFSDKKLTCKNLIEYGSMTQEMADFLKLAVEKRQNILVSGGTGSGKTTLLNVLSQFIPSGERVVTVEDSAELKLSHRDKVRLEARPANIEGKGRVTIRDLVINCLRMRPDRIIVGECRGAEALDMLQAMNTGHNGSLTTVHANNPRDALTRLENMVMMAGFELPSTVIREQIASAINVIVQQTRLPDGNRKIVQISELTGRQGDTFQLLDIFHFKREGIDEKKHVKGRHLANGNIPEFVSELRKDGEDIDMRMFKVK